MNECVAQADLPEADVRARPEAALQLMSGESADRIMGQLFARTRAAMRDA